MHLAVWRLFDNLYKRIPHLLVKRWWFWGWLLHSRALEPCSLVIKIRALNAHAPTLTIKNVIMHSLTQLFQHKINQAKQ